jgi:hypothetical protein
MRAIGIFFGIYFFSKGSIYLLRIYSDLLALSVLQCTLILALAPTPTLRRIYAGFISRCMGLLKNPNKSQKK